ncbi:MAG: NAD-dependent epimerase/dehydratase family protein [Planctomycetaceae bacterium]|nr:NAD-dependent epimerase/dehydratase family protein [Planctomycetaceae bacterium]
MQKIAITGSSGFYGRGLIEGLRSLYPEATILGLDVVEPSVHPPDEFLHCDVTSPKLRSHLETFAPETVIHLAFVVNPMRDLRRMHEINIEGTRNLLAAVENIGPARLLVSSSATAYGAWDDNPIPIPEDHHLRPRTEYQYAHDKVLVEELLAEFRDQHPEIAVSWTRAAIIYGEGVDNYLTKFILRSPLMVLPDGHNATFQLVHLEDVVAATLKILTSNASGPFNIAPPDWITLKDLAKLKRQICLKSPLVMCRLFTNIWWGLRLPLFYFPSGLWYFIRYPWVVTPRRLQEEIGYEFRYSTLKTVREMLHHGGYRNIPELELETPSQSHI